MRAIARIAQLVEGMPLGIELAASWLRSMSPQDIASEIERSRDFLSTTMRNVPERHRSMRAIFDESWRLLSDAERDAFSKLSVFSGSFERSAAREVAGAGVPLLSALVDKSLLKPAGSGRYQVHEVLRQYAEEQLAASPHEVQHARDRHCDYYLGVLRSSFQIALQGDQLRLCEEVERELENIRAAWLWAIEQGKLSDLQTAGQALSIFFQYKGRYAEAVMALQRAVAGLREHQDSREAAVSFATLLTHAGWAYMRVGRLDDTERASAEAAAIYERLQELPSWGWSTDPASYRGVVATIRGAYDEAAAAGERARENAERSNNPWNLAIAFYVLTRSALLRGDYQAAQSHANRALEAATGANDHWFQAYCLVELGNVAVSLEDYAAARDYYRASYDIRSEFGDPEGMAHALNALGELSHKEGDLQRALSEFSESLELYEAINDKGGLASALIGRARTATESGDFEAAKADFARALPIVAEMSFLPLLLTVVLGVGDLLVRAGDRQSGSLLLRVALWHPAGDSDSRTAALRLLAQDGQEPPFAETLGESDIDDASVILENALSLPRSQSLAPLVTSLVRSPEPRAGDGSRRVYPHDLTEREVEVLNLVARGKSNREIADTLFISVNTAANHVKNILAKTNAANRTEAAAFAIAADLLR